MIHLLADIGNFCLWGSSVLIVVFVVQYSLLARWWANPIGVTIVGLDLCILAIFIPSLLALADPAGFAHFATARWYLFLTVGVVVATFLFAATRIITWEAIRRRRSGVLLPGAMAARIAELEDELAEFRERHGQT
jgi:hypothetical protein